MENSDNELVDCLLADAVRKGVNYYGIEGYEDVVNRNYGSNSTLKTRLLSTFRGIYFKK